MNKWMLVIVLVLIGYLIGVKWPQYGNQALAKVGM